MNYSRRTDFYLAHLTDENTGIRAKAAKAFQKGRVIRIRLSFFVGCHAFLFEGLLKLDNFAEP